MPLISADNVRWITGTVVWRKIDGCVAYRRDKLRVAYLRVLMGAPCEKDDREIKAARIRSVVEILFMFCSARHAARNKTNADLLARDARVITFDRITRDREITRDEGQARGNHVPPPVGVF